MDHQGILVVVSGFSGAGKGTLMKELLKRYDNYALSISATTGHPEKGKQTEKSIFSFQRNSLKRCVMSRN